MADDYYQILGVDPEAPPDHIQAAYVRIMARLRAQGRPDSAETEAEIRRVETAYEALSDYRSRAKYDALEAVFPDRTGDATEPVADASLDPDGGFSLRLLLAWVLVVAGPATAGSGALGAYVIREHYNRFLVMLVPPSVDQDLYFGMIAGGIVMAGIGAFLFVITDAEWAALMTPPRRGDKPPPDW